MLHMPSFYVNDTLKSSFKFFNTFINDFSPNFIPLFNNGFFYGIDMAYSSPLVYILF